MADGSESLVSVELLGRGEQTEIVPPHSEFREGHGPAPYKIGRDGGFDKVEEHLARSGADA